MPDRFVVGRIPFLNCAPFFHDVERRLGADASGIAFTDLVPRALGRAMLEGTVDAGPVPVADYLRMKDELTRVGRLGIATRERAGSVLLFSTKPIGKLGGARVAITGQTSTSGLLVRLILEGRYQVEPAAYVPADELEDSTGRALEGGGACEARLAIGDEALEMRAGAGLRYRHCLDLGLEWSRWTGLPCVFAVWAARNGRIPPGLESALRDGASTWRERLDVIWEARPPLRGMSRAGAGVYLGRFTYDFGEAEEKALEKFSALCGSILRSREGLAAR